MSDLKISIVTISYNEVNNIRKTMESVLRQTYPNIEYIVVDGGSRDGTSEIIKGYSNRFAYWCSEKDGGLYFGMNKGLAKCTGDYVLFCNAGDSLASKDIIAKMVEAAEKSEMPDLVYGDCASMINGKMMVRTAHGPGFINFGMPASHETMLYKRTIIVANQITYDTSYRIAADYKFTYQFVKQSKTFVALHEPVVLFDEMGVSCTNRWQGLSESSRARKEAGGISLPRRAYIIAVQLCALFLSGYMGSLYRAIRLKKSKNDI